MGLYLNFIFAWISIILVILLTIIYFLRIFRKKAKWITTLNRKLRRYHKHIGIVLLLTGLLHGIFSSERLLTLNLGTVCWILSMLLGLNYVFRSIFTKKSHWIVYHRILTLIFIVIIVLHIIDVGGIQVHNILFKNTVEDTKITNTPTANTTPRPTKNITNTTPPTPTATETISKYIDGTYTGTATGFREGLVVEITIKNDAIISVEVIEHNEVNRKFWGYPVEFIPKAIVESQSTDVDTVSGATYTSIGIISATENALSKAMK